MPFQPAAYMIIAAMSADPQLEIERVAGDMSIEIESREGPEGPMYRSEGVFTEAKLPIGYPAPTPPGAIELKDYPSVRRAEVSGTGERTDASRRGFFPLFQHISRHGIAMTAPVEMEYARDGNQDNDAWTMAFLYHEESDGPTGKDRGGVTVVDAPSVRVLSLGVRGVATLDDPEERMAPLVEWLDASDEWRAVEDTPYRVLGYNGPYIPPANRWWEVQIVVERVEPDNAEDATAD